MVFYETRDREAKREREKERKKEQIRNLLQLLWQFEVIARVALAENGEVKDSAKLRRKNVQKD